VFPFYARTKAVGLLENVIIDFHVEPEGALSVRGCRMSDKMLEIGCRLKVILN
jgi:hypothetical protein